MRILLCSALVGLILAVIGAAYYGEMFNPWTDNINTKEFDPIPGGWTDELLQTYKESEKIELLKYWPISGFTINDENIMIERLVIVVIPDRMENRGSFSSYLKTMTSENEGILIGDRNESLQYHSPVAYVFTNMSVSKALYDRHKEFDEPGITGQEIEVMCIDLTLQILYDEDGEINR